MWSSPLRQYNFNGLSSRLPRAFNFPWTNQPEEAASLDLVPLLSRSPSPVAGPSSLAMASEPHVDVDEAAALAAVATAGYPSDKKEDIYDLHSIVEEEYDPNGQLPSEEERHTLRRVADNVPLTAWLIVFVELAERFSWCVRIVLSLLLLLVDLYFPKGTELQVSYSLTQAVKPLF
jgi:hypothetical protein